MTIWRAAALKRGITQRQQVYAMLHRRYWRELDEPVERGDTLVLITGFSHELNDTELEIIVRVHGDGRQAEVFHCNYLTDKIRRYREENPDGWLN